jgi:hypothetical protein
LRPDGSSHNSFPSGHTATAFMTAMMLSKEYGGENPWYSIAGFTISTVTGLTRMANNRHWLSDVLAGAGFGILSTETGYFLADLIFRDKGIRYYDDDDSFDRLHKPSFFGVSLGLNKIPGSYRLENGSKIAFSSGGTAGLEGAGFLTPYFGLGARLSASTVSFTYNNVAGERDTRRLVTFPRNLFFLSAFVPVCSRRQSSSRLQLFSQMQTVGHDDRQERWFGRGSRNILLLLCQSESRSEVLHGLQSSANACCDE